MANHGKTGGPNQSRETPYHCAPATKFRKRSDPRYRIYCATGDVFRLEVHPPIDPRRTVLLQLATSRIINGHPTSDPDHRSAGAIQDTHFKRPASSFGHRTWASLVCHLGLNLQNSHVQWRVAQCPCVSRYISREVDRHQPRHLSCIWHTTCQ